ncbi:NADH-quinone oxidoreductase subunit NuoF [candidate division KSB1 bacterium]|nr:NADH-quinone oxidoreductase subunit NuoF [candidate division KSB1 bacterium]
MNNKIIMKNMEQPGYTGSLKDYEAEGGYSALKKALGEMSQDAIIEEVKKSGLRGRGGAGFPTGMKWSFVPKDTPKARYLINNADESEPGTFKDRAIMIRDPHLTLEGQIISSYVIKCNVSYIYIRGEFYREAEILERAIKEAENAGYLGDNILGSGFDHRIYVHRGAGAYICGEETGLIESLEGKRGWPRIKPPFPALEGAFGCPTVVNNTETLANIPFIINNGYAAFASIGVERGTGTKVYCISGHVKKPGLYEFPMGITLKELIYDCADGIRDDNNLKAVIPGGASMPVLTPGEIDVKMDFDSLAKIGSHLGSAGIIVMDDKTCMVDACLNLSKFYAHESCGQCTPCREGMGWMKSILDRIEHGQGEPDDIDLLLEITNNIEGRTICAFGEAGAWPVRAFVTKFRSEFEEHVKQKKCVLAA